MDTHTHTHTHKHCLFNGHSRGLVSSEEALCGGTAGWMSFLLHLAMERKRTGEREGERSEKKKGEMEKVGEKESEAEDEGNGET